MEWLEIEALADKNYSQLSGGEKQRVQLARVLLQIEMGQGNKSRVLLLDEPAAHLDIARVHELLRLRRKLLRQSPVAVVLVLHDLNLALAYANKIALLHEGRIMALGAPEEVLNPHLIKSVFGLNLQQLVNAQGTWLLPKVPKDFEKNF